MGKYGPIAQIGAPDELAENEKPDNRTTLFWAPEIITHPGANKATITFYNNDITNSFRVIIEGVSKDGKFAHFEKILE